MKHANVHEPFKNPRDLWERRRRHIARHAEIASHLKDNICGPELEEFTFRYGMRKSAFA